jgi:hypothetical protein
MYSSLLSFVLRAPPSQNLPDFIIVITGQYRWYKRIFKSPLKMRRGTSHKGFVEFLKCLSRCDAEIMMAHINSQELNAVICYSIVDESWRRFC